MRRLLPLFIVITLAAFTPLSWAGFSNESLIGDFVSLSEVLEKRAALNAVPTIATTTVFFTGDVMLARKVERLTAQNGQDYPFRNLFLPEKQSYLVGNFEAVIPQVHQPTKDFHFAFSVPTTSIPFVKEYGFTHFSLANNHSYDFGATGYKNTRAVLSENNLISFGGHSLNLDNSVSFLDLNKQKVALIGISAVEKAPSQSALEKLFSELEEQSDLQIIYIHWGTEYKSTHSTFQRKLAESMVTLGADLIVGHHPHVVQDIELIDGVPVFYSLGNLIFDQYFSDDVQQGLVLELDFTEEGKQVILLPVSSLNSQSSPYLMDFGNKRVFLSDLATRSDKALSDAIIEGVISLP